MPTLGRENPQNQSNNLICILCHKRALDIIIDESTSLVNIEKLIV